MTGAYQTLERRFRRINTFAGASAMLQWDWAAMMPLGGADARAEQLAELDILRHELMTAPELGDLLNRAEQDAGALDDWQRANLGEMRHRWIHATSVPADLVEALSRASAACELVWRDARPAGDFAAFAETFAPVLALVREKAAVLGQALDCAPYDALIDTYDPGISQAIIDPVFDDLSRFLPEFLGRVLERQNTAGKPTPIAGIFPATAQRALGEALMKRLGFDFAHGRLDVSDHPFCGGVPGDIRITTRYADGDFSSGLMGVLHETGHALYEMGLPDEWRLQPVGDARGMSVHESQSLLVEMQACRSRAFVEFMAPIARETFEAHNIALGSGFDAENLYRHATWVEPGFIRVDADEVTYPSHIMLRYRLEQALIAGDLAVDDIPGAWNEGMKSLLGLTPPSPTVGCLQDIHWAAGEVGYFPSYTFGALIAAQLFDAAAQADAQVVPGIAAGNFSPLISWLREAVHGQASRYDSDTLITKATGRPLDPGVFKRHLETRYLA